MKKAFFPLLAILCLLLCPAARAFHEHVDIDGADTLISGYRAATENADGYTGDEVCSVCGAVIKSGSRIPSLQEQRGFAATPVPTKEVRPTASAATPVPTAIPTPEPTRAPTPVPVQTPAFQPPEESAAPTRVPSPAPTATPSPVPTPVAPDSGERGTSSGSPTRQPDLSGLSGGASSGSSGSSASSGGSSGRGSVSGGGCRNLSGRTAFSLRFPWRRLRMTPSSGILLPLAGELVWPLEESSSPLMMLMIPGK